MLELMLSIFFLTIVQNLLETSFEEVQVVPTAAALEFKKEFV